MILSLIAAVADNRVIGHQDKMPWHLPNDLRRFQMLTTGETVIMGRRTYESIGRVLPGRLNVVVSQNRQLIKDNRALVMPDLDLAIHCLPLFADHYGLTTRQMMVIGGATIYRQCLPQVQQMFITEVHGEPVGDVLFPEIDWEDWEEVSREDHLADNQHSHDYSFVVYRRKGVEIPASPPVDRRKGGRRESDRRLS